MEAVVIGSGPNGLVAAVTLARAGWSVTVLEAADHPGGGLRTEELTLPGFAHDVCSAIHPLGVASPALTELDLPAHGVRWIHPEVPLAHPLDGHRTALLHRSLDRTVEELGADGPAWRSTFGPAVAAGLELSDSLLDPLRLPPRHPLHLARAAPDLLRPATALSARFDDRDGPGAALLAGLAAHSVLPLDAPVTGGVALLLGMLGHVVGWPLAEGGSASIAAALVRLLEAEGGHVECGERVRSLDDLPPAAVVLADVAPRQLVDLAGDRLPARYRRRLGRYRHGPGVFKLDWALDGPVPWSDPDVARAATVHLGGTFADVAGAERAVARGGHPDEPFVLLAQQSAFDPTRCPDGAATVWAYCHVPHGSPVDMTDAVERRVEAFAPGFRDRILARHVAGPAWMESHDANHVGGDITGGVADLRQFVARPVASRRPWATPARGLYLCSASTPPGAGVHGMCGRAAARAVLEDAARGRL